MFRQTLHPQTCSENAIKRNRFVNRIILLGFHYISYMNNYDEVLLLLEKKRTILKFFVDE